MEFVAMRNFNLYEKVATLKLILKIASSDNHISEEEEKTIQKFLHFSDLKLSEEFYEKALNESIENIVAVFINKTNLNKAWNIVTEYANKHGINPEFEGKMLEEINEAIETQKKNMKFSIKEFFKTLFQEFGYLWGKEDIDPRMKNILAIIFVAIACILGSFWTEDSWWRSAKTHLIDLNNFFPAAVCGLLLVGALTFRGYMPKPTSFRTLIFFVVDVYLLSIICKLIIGEGFFEERITATLLLAIVLLMWLGIKEILGFVLIALFGLFIYKLFSISEILQWRAFPFIISAFIGISFQSENFFDDFTSLSNSLIKESKINKELAKESIEASGKISTEALKTISKSGAKAASSAAGMPPI